MPHTCHEGYHHSVHNVDESHNTLSARLISSKIKTISCDRHQDKLDSIKNEPARDDSQKSTKLFRWHSQLIFRTKLTMHTAYDMKGNAEPASITSLAISKDHRTVFIGNYQNIVCFHIDLFI